jgi:hypothetical protein
MKLLTLSKLSTFFDALFTTTEKQITTQTPVLIGTAGGQNDGNTKILSNRIFVLTTMKELQLAILKVPIVLMLVLAI